MQELTIKEQQSLLESRQKIDKIDKQLVDLLNERASHACHIGSLKRQAGDTNIYHPRRESDILQKIHADNQGPISDKAFCNLFKEFFAIHRVLQGPFRVGYLGPAGTYSQQMVLNLFGYYTDTLASLEMPQLWDNLLNGDTQLAIIPYYNTSGGYIGDHSARLATKEFAVLEGHYLNVHHHLLVKSSLDINDVKVVYAHEQSLKQCKIWLDKFLPEVKLCPVQSNAIACQQAEQQYDIGAAAIAGDMSKQFYGLSSLAEGIQNTPDNRTLFLSVISLSEINISSESLLLQAGLYENNNNCSDNNLLESSKVSMGPGLWSNLNQNDIENNQMKLLGKMNVVIR